MSKQHFPKEICQRAHAIARAKQRFNLELSWVDLIDIKDAIKDGKARFLKKQSNRVSLWELMVKGNLMKVVYDSKRHTVVTVMYPEPPECDSKEVAE